MFRLLVVTAHPDDEAGGFGGALLRYRACGVETHVLCLTPGQAGSHRGGAATDADLIAMRTREFEASCRLLQVSNAEVLAYPDGKLDRLDFFAVVEDLTRRMRRLRPHVVLTFGGEGAFTAHPDHTMTSLFTTAAFHWASRSNRFVHQLQDGLQPHQAQKLYYQTVPFTMPERQPVSLPPATAVLDITEHVETKRAAFHLHKSQEPLFPIFDRALDMRGHEELYHLVAVNTPQRIPIENDLFAGVNA